MGAWGRGLDLWELRPRSSRQHRGQEPPSPMHPVSRCMSPLSTGALFGVLAPAQPCPGMPLGGGSLKRPEGPSHQHHDLESQAQAWVPDGRDMLVPAQEVPNLAYQGIKGSECIRGWGQCFGPLVRKMSMTFPKKNMAQKQSNSPGTKMLFFDADNF